MDLKIKVDVEGALLYGKAPEIRYEMLRAE